MSTRGTADAEPDAAADADEGGAGLDAEADAVELAAASAVAFAARARVPSARPAQATATRIAVARCVAGLRARVGGIVVMRPYPFGGLAQPGRSRAPVGIQIASRSTSRVPIPRRAC
jgi:hypothetical protein